MKNIQEIKDQEKMLDKLYTALDAMKGQEILADNQTKNGFSGDKVFNDFNWSLFKSSDDILKITLENDLDYDSNDTVGALPIYFRINQIKDIEIDDNLNEYSEFLEDGLKEKYTVENIWITLKNNNTLRLEVQW